MDGPIGETSELFLLPLEDFNELWLDMTHVTFINSVGVKQWILWNAKFPRDFRVKIINCPFVIATQASIVIGFVTPNITIESFRAPFVCESCGAEELKLLNRGTDYEYAKRKFALQSSPDDEEAKINLPAVSTCPKCKKNTQEPDFIVEKTFKFLNINFPQLK